MFVIPKRAAVSGICAITESGICPFSLSSLNPELLGITTGAGAGAACTGAGAA